jgi:DNA modification methylase
MVEGKEVMDAATPGPSNGGSECAGKSLGPAGPRRVTRSGVAASAGVVRGDARRLPVRTSSVACVVTSPPYNLSVPYEGCGDRMPWPAYWELIHRSCREMARVLVPGGRVWLNVMRAEPDRTGQSIRGRKAKGHEVARVDLARMWAEGLEGAGLAYRETIVWAQDAWDGACSWGSWRMPSAPNLRGEYEVVLVYHKGLWRRCPPLGLEDWRDDLPGWEECCRNVWCISPARSMEHPAVFPDELVRRCIRLSTWPGEIVLDPFAGAGTVVRVARELGRHGVGVELSEVYAGLARHATAQGVLL